MKRVLAWKDLKNITKSLDSGAILEHLSIRDLPKKRIGSYVLLPATTMVFDLAGSSVSIRDHGALKFVARYQNMFRNLTDIIYDKEGIIEKFPGDGISMHFVQKDLEEESAELCRRKAAEAAIEIIKYMLVEEDVTSRFRLSLAYGKDTIATKIGSDHHLEWISIGHAVNVAHKLEKVIKTAGCLMGMDEACFKALQACHPYGSGGRPYPMPKDLRRIQTTPENWYGFI